MIQKPCEVARLAMMSVIRARLLLPGQALPLSPVPAEEGRRLSYGKGRNPTVAGPSPNRVSNMLVLNLHCAPFRFVLSINGVDGMST